MEGRVSQETNDHETGSKQHLTLFSTATRRYSQEDRTLLNSYSFS
jgi:hypothetical protein